MAAFKYNERDNQTDSNTYQFYHINTQSTLQTVVNTPMSNKRIQFDLGGDYRITSKQKLNVAYEHEKITRWCNNDLANNSQGPLAFSHLPRRLRRLQARITP